MNKKIEFLRTLIRDVPDFPTRGIIFKDITPLLADKNGLKIALGEMLKPWKQHGITKVASIESRGFIFGAPLAMKLGAGFVPLRKPGKLPYKKESLTYQLEYGSDTIEVHIDAFSSQDRVVIVDDLLATGGSARAASTLIKKLGAEVVGAQFLIELEFLNGRKNLEGIPVIRSILTY